MNVFQFRTQESWSRVWVEYGSSVVWARFELECSQSDLVKALFFEGGHLTPPSCDLMINTILWLLHSNCFAKTTLDMGSQRNCCPKATFHVPLCACVLLVTPVVTCSNTCKKLLVAQRSVVASMLLAISCNLGGLILAKFQTARNMFPKRFQPSHQLFQRDFNQVANKLRASFKQVPGFNLFQRGFKQAEVLAKQMIGALDGEKHELALDDCLSGLSLSPVVPHSGLNYVQFRPELPMIPWHSIKLPKRTNPSNRGLDLDCSLQGSHRSNRLAASF